MADGSLSLLPSCKNVGAFPSKLPLARPPDAIVSPFPLCLRPAQRFGSTTLSINEGATNHRLSIGRKGQRRVGRALA